MSAATPVKVLCCWCGGLCCFRAPALPPLAVRSMTGPSRFLSNGAVTWLELCNEEGTDLLALLHASVSPTLPYYPGGNWRADFCVLLMLMGWCNLFHSRVRKVKATQHRPSAPQLLRASAAGPVCTRVFSTALRHSLHTIDNSVFLFCFVFNWIGRVVQASLRSSVRHPQRSSVPVSDHFQPHTLLPVTGNSLPFFRFVFSRCFTTVALTTHM